MATLTKAEIETALKALDAWGDKPYVRPSELLPAGLKGYVVAQTLWGEMLPAGKLQRMVSGRLELTAETKATLTP
jgi:hypothetical protein